MNPKLKEINGLITLCDQMLSITQERGFISTNHELYQTYKRLVKPFCINNDIYDDQYAPYVVLNEFYRSNTKLNRSMVCQIRGTLIAIKHFLFENSYEKIFISHREKDADQVHAFIDLLHAMGIPSPTIEAPESVIFCTSHPEGYIENGKRNLDEIRDRINTDEHVLYILWYTDKYFESPACLNEAGAIWAMKKKYQEILMPNFDSGKIKGLLDKQQVWFRANDKMRLNTFKEQVEKMFALPPTTSNAWEMARDKFVQTIQAAGKAGSVVQN
jgi:hypothetical protein